MLAQVVDAPSAPLGELGPGLAGSTLLVLFLLVTTLVVLRAVLLQRRGRARTGGPLEVVAQLELAAGQALYLVRAGGRYLLIGGTGGGTGGGLGLLTELEPAQVGSLGSAPVEPRSGTLLQRLRARLLGAPAVATLDAAVLGIAGVAGVEHAAPPARRELGRKG